MANILAKEHGEIWINHDKPQRESLKLAPAFYEMTHNV
jgi:N-acyl homoserine lactone hydrolase